MYSIKRGELVLLMNTRKYIGKYINIPLPSELAKQIDNVIETAELGYKTKSEFVKEAVREKLIELDKLKGLKKRK